MNKLDCIEIFRHVARLESFTATANELNMTQGAVSKKIAWLEQDLGFALFHRNPRKVTLTDAGKQYLTFGNELLEKITLTEQQLRNELNQATGKLNISAPSAFATHRLAEPIQQFVALNPKLTINISVNDKQVNLYEEDIDIAIRASLLKDSRLKAKKLLEHQVCYFASPSYIEKYGKPQTPDELSSHRCITYSLFNSSNIWQINNEKYSVPVSMSSDSPEMIVKLAELGSGIAAMPFWMVKEQLEQKQLIELFNDAQKYSLPMYALYKNSDYIPFRVRAFIDFLADYFASE